MDDLTIPFLGAGTGCLAVPVRLAAAGRRDARDGLRLGVSTADPLLEIEIAVDPRLRRARGERPPFLPDERIELIDALAGFTRGSAWVNHLDDEIGSIEVGKLADLAVLDRDLFDRGAGRDRRGAGHRARSSTACAVHEAPALERLTARPARSMDR